MSPPRAHATSSSCRRSATANTTAGSQRLNAAIYPPAGHPPESAAGPRLPGVRQGHRPHPPRWRAPQSRHRPPGLYELMWGRRQSCKGACGAGLQPCNPGARSLQPGGRARLPRRLVEPQRARSLDADPPFGLRREDLIAKDAGDAVVSEGRTAYDTWSLDRATAIANGSSPSLQIRTVTEFAHAGEWPTGVDRAPAR